MSKKPETPGIKPAGGEEAAVQTRQKVKRPQLYRVLLHNDNYTTMEFVVVVLMQIFRHNQEDAFRIMMNVHQRGLGVAGVYSYEVAETKAAKVIELARANEYPLLCSVEPDV
jgi:ATP-dependent Clp protease adaptor protein ClpS